jgi:hypothetical protein
VLSAHVHPEFGYLCPSRGLRRVLHVTFAFVVLGAIAGVSGVASLMADHDLNSSNIPIAARSEGSGTEPMRDPVAAPPAATGQVAAAESVKPGTGKPAAAGKDAAGNDAVASSAGRSDAGKSDAGKPGSVRNDAEASCDESIWAYLDGKCAAGKVRKVRVARPAPASAEPSPTKATQGAGGDAAAPAEPSAKPAAANKPQRTAASSNRQRNPADHPAAREARAGAGHAAEAPRGRFARGPLADFFGLFR